MTYVTTFQHTVSGDLFEAHDPFATDCPDALDYARSILAVEMAYPAKDDTVHDWRLLRCEFVHPVTGARHQQFRIASPLADSGTVHRGDRKEDA